MVTVAGGASTVSVALADLVGSAELFAVTVTEPPDGTDAGAVYSPADDTVPTVEFPPCNPLTHHVTAVFVEPLTLAANCCDAPV
jgi:hypothetical protein